MPPDQNNQPDNNLPNVNPRPSGDPNQPTIISPGTQETASVTPVAQAPVSPPAEAPNQPLPPAPASTINKPISRSQLGIEPDKKSHGKLFTFLGILVIIFCAGLILYQDKNLQAFIFRETLSTYNYPQNQYGDYSIKFFRGSKIVNIAPDVVSGQPSLGSIPLLNSPVIAGKSPIALFVVDVPDTTNADELYAAFDNCNLPNTKLGFSVYLTNFDANANFCASGSPVAGYYTTFEDSGTFYMIFIADNPSNNTGSQTASNNLDLSKYQGDIQNIAESFKLVKK